MVSITTLSGTADLDHRVTHFLKIRCRNFKLH